MPKSQKNILTERKELMPKNPRLPNKIFRDKEKD